MRLKYVTFTGVDSRTDINRLKSIQEEYPYVEFGVLLSDDWAYNGCRFPDPAICEKLANAGIKNLSAHLCGKLAIDVAYGFTDRVNAASFECFDTFSRCQLNLRAAGMFETLRLMKPFSNLKEIIVQMHTPELCSEFLKEQSPAGLAYLLDASGGLGIDTPIEIITSPGVHIGYAGGMGPENVEKKLRALLSAEYDDEIWIDMETRVRTVASDGEWFDLDKVENVLRTCNRILQEYGFDTQDPTKKWERNMDYTIDYIERKL